MFDLGLYLSEALPTPVSSEPNPQPKAIGECVWKATKLSGGIAAINALKSVGQSWPSDKVVS
jgi:hypothetical protein